MSIRVHGVMHNVRITKFRMSTVFPDSVIYSEPLCHWCSSIFLAIHLGLARAYATTCVVIRPWMRRINSIAYRLKSIGRAYLWPGPYRPSGIGWSVLPFMNSWSHLLFSGHRLRLLFPCRRPRLLFATGRSRLTSHVHPSQLPLQELDREWILLLAFCLLQTLHS